MTAQTDPYVRVYYRVIDDPKFADVFDHDDRLACWMRLLLIADGTYPAPAPIPHGVKKAALAHLVGVGLIDLEPGSRYRIHGMDSERGDRSKKAADAANEKWRREREAATADALAVQTHSDSNAGASPGIMHSTPLLSAPLQSDPLRSVPNGRTPDDLMRHGLPHIDPETATVLEGATGMLITTLNGWPATRLDQLVERRTGERVRTAVATVTAGLTERPGWEQLVNAVQAELDPPIGRSGKLAASPPKGSVQSIAEIREALDARR